MVLAFLVIQLTPASPAAPARTTRSRPQDNPQDYAGGLPALATIVVPSCRPEVSRPGSRRYDNDPEYARATASRGSVPHGIHLRPARLGRPARAGRAGRSSGSGARRDPQVGPASRRR